MSLTLAEAKERHKKRIRKGTKCVLCGRYDKVYARTPTSGMVVALSLMHDGFKEKYVKHSDLRKKLGNTGSDFTLMIFWGLIKRSSKTRDYYRVTSRGLLWLQGKIKIARYAYVYHGKLLRLSKRLVTVHEAWGAHFDLKALLDS